MYSPGSNTNKASTATPHKNDHPQPSGIQDSYVVHTVANFIPFAIMRFFAKKPPLKQKLPRGRCPHKSFESSYLLLISLIT